MMKKRMDSVHTIVDDDDVDCSFGWGGLELLFAAMMHRGWLEVRSERQRTTTDELG